MALDIQTDHRCRVCLNVAEQAFFLQESISGSEEALSYVDVLMLCCNIQISLDDEKPKKICLVCTENARISYEFKICCERSNLLLENEIYIPNTFNSHFEDVKDTDAYNSLSDDSLSNDVKDLNIVSINKRTPELIHSVEKTDINLVESPILKYVEENIPELDGDIETTVSNSHTTDSNEILTSRSQVNNNENIQSKSCKSQTVFICKCGKSYLSKDSYNNHRRINECNIPEDTVHKCSTCKSTFKSFRMLSEHILEKHIAVGKCSYCDTILVDYTCLILHMQEYHSDILCGDIFCEICGAVVTDAKHMSRHKELHKILYECKHCDFSNRYYEGFLGHMRNQHDVTEMAEGKDFSKCERFNECSYCKYTTTIKIKFARHMQLEHEDKKTFICKKCDAKFFTNDRLRVHCENQHSNVEKIYESKRRLHCHSQIFKKIDEKFCEVKRNKFICDVCGRLCNNRHVLKQHMYTHTGERPHKCKFCSMAFKQSSTLGNHLLGVHSEERNSKCDICGKGFKTSSCLNQHNKRVHTRQRNNKCTVCDKSFFTKKELRHHSVVHTGSKLFKCEICNKGFGIMKTLQIHKLIHTGEKPHMCHVCGVGFNQSYCLKMHLLKHTNTDSKSNLEM